MPRTLFDQVLVPKTPRRTPRWMKAVSLAAHLVVVFIVMVLPITAALDVPGVQSGLPPVVLASVPSPPPPVPPTTVAHVPTAAPSVPLAPPDGITPEVIRPPSPTALSVPGGVDVSISNLGAPVGTNVLAPPPAPRPPEPPRRVGGVIRQPERTVFKAPVYPAVAQAARLEGTVILEALIDEHGVVQNVTVLRSVALLDNAAIYAVRQWRYTPTRLNGIPISILMSVTVTFSIR